MKIIKETCTKGTNIYLGNKKRVLLNKCVDILINDGFTEIQIPILQNAEIFKNKVGEENNNMMYFFTDKGNRNLCLPPEYTAVIMKLTDTFKYQKNVKLFYIVECFRGENPQKGRWRQFIQLGVEIINPSKDYDLSGLAIQLTQTFTNEELVLNKKVQRGLDYYNGGEGFEIKTLDDMQIVGGGTYINGIGFAIGIDRLLFK
jgi:histidyl-tRNA synthetase